MNDKEKEMLNEKVGHAIYTLEDDMHDPEAYFENVAGEETAKRFVKAMRSIVEAVAEVTDTDLCESLERALYWAHVPEEDIAQADDAFQEDDDEPPF